MSAQAPAERVLARDIQPGDCVARARTHQFALVAAVRPGPVAVRLLNAHGQTIARPRADAKWWRLTS